MHYVKYCTRAWVKRKYSTRQASCYIYPWDHTRVQNFTKCSLENDFSEDFLLNRSSLLAFCVLGNGILSTNTTQIFYTLEWAIRLAMATTMTCCSARRTSRPQRRESSDFVAEPSAKRQHLSLKLSKKKAPLAEPSNRFAVSVDEQTCERASERLKPATQRPALDWQLKTSPHGLEQLYYQHFLPLLSILLDWVCVVLLATICFLLFLFCSPQLQYVCFLLLLYHQLIAHCHCATV